MPRWPGTHSSIASNTQYHSELLLSTNAHAFPHAFFALAMGRPRGGGGSLIAFDGFGVGIGDEVLIIQGSVAAHYCSSPVDAMVVGIVDPAEVSSTGTTAVEHWLFVNTQASPTNSKHPQAKACKARPVDTLRSS